MYPQKYWAFIKTLANGDTYVHFKLKYYIRNLQSRGKHWSSPQGGTFYRTPDQSSSRLLQSWKWERPGNSHRPGQTGEAWQLECAVELREDSGTEKRTGEVQVKSGVELLLMDRYQLSFDKCLMIIEDACYGEVGWVLYGILCSTVETFSPVNLNHSKIKSS